MLIFIFVDQLLNVFFSLLYL